jgi:hypothetical protein
MKLPLILFSLFVCQLANAQASLPEFGVYTNDEINLKECPFAKNAEAVILLDQAVADHDDDYQLITHRRIRIKILHQREADRGNIRIRFYSKDKFEYISDIRGMTYNEEGGIPVITQLNNKSIYTEKEDNYYSSIRFALPNVKAGSILEYEYDSHMKHYGGLRDWIFQNDIPTLKSCFLLTILPNTAFQYSVQKKSFYPIVIKPTKDVGKIYFEMNNLPGLKFEPYMDAVNDYLQKVIFQLAQYTSQSGGQTKVNQTWRDLAYDLTGDRDFGGVIKKDLSKIDDIKNIVSKETTDSGKVAAIYNYVRNNFTWNHYYSKYAQEGLKNVWEKRTGSAGEINLLLINLLQTFHIEVYPLLVAERDFGKIDTTYPFLDRFNKVVAYAKADGKTFILDATEKFSPPGLTPYALLNTIAFIVDKKDFNLVRILTSKNAYENTITVNANVDTKGSMKGAAEITSYRYSKQLRTKKIKTDLKKFSKEILEEFSIGSSIDNYSFDNIDDDNKPLVESIAFHNDLNESGGYILVPYNFFTGLVKNPFTAEERFTNVNFGYPYNIRLQAKIQLPERSKIDKLPAEKTIIAPDGTISAYRSVTAKNNMLVVTIIFRQTVTLIPYDQYANLRSVYMQITQLLNEPVVIRISE